MRLAVRQPESDWLARLIPPASYRDRLRGEVHPGPARKTSGGEYQSKDGIFEQSVTHVEHFTDDLFSFRHHAARKFPFPFGRVRNDRPAECGGPRVPRILTGANPAWDDELEFYSIKVPGGPLTQHLQHIAVGDTVLLKKKATGTLVLDALRPGRRLFLFSTGTGIAPFASIIRDPETYERFEQIVLTQTCRAAAELTYGNSLVARISDDPIVGELVREGRLVHVTSLTRAAHPLQGRMTSLIESGALFETLSAPPIDPENDRAMICGSVAMLSDMRAILDRLSLEEGSNARPGGYVVERAFVD